MPKEIIFTDQPAFIRNAEGNETPVNGPGATDGPLPGTVLQRALHIGWDRLGYVEIGVTELLPSTQERDPEAEFTGMFASFDRAALNRAIVALRKARDAAFGRDA